VAGNDCSGAVLGAGAAARLAEGHPAPDATPYPVSTEGSEGATLHRAAAVLTILGGALAAIFTLGRRILDIRDLGWLLHGTLGPDPVAYWLAWKYFAPAPWSWPPGLNPEYGLELSSAIFYVDAVPLMAFLAKLLRPFVEIPQYWGPWLVLSAALQAAMAWRLLGIAVKDPVARGLGALLFAWQPLLLDRMGGHFALVGQWAVLWSLWLCIREEDRDQTTQWTACLGIAAMVNAYILAMCGGLWAADWLARLLRGGARMRLALQAAMAPAAAAAGLWMAGFFTITGDVVPVGLRYGESQLDLTAPFDAVEWGWLLPELPGLRHWEYGGSYLGAGVLLVLTIGAVLLRDAGAGAAVRRRAVLVAVLAAMLAFALSNRLAVAGHVARLASLLLACRLRAALRRDRAGRAQAERDAASSAARDGAAAAGGGCGCRHGTVPLAGRRGAADCAGSPA
jgi:hypothetical protein